MNDQIMCYNQKCVKQYTISLNASITCMEKFDHANSKYIGILVALDNQEVRIYKEKEIIYTLNAEGIVTAMRFGTFGREAGALVMLYKQKGLDVKILHRKFDFTNSNQVKAKSDRNLEDIPLNIPRKTKLFIEQT